MRRLFNISLLLILAGLAGCDNITVQPDPPPSAAPTTTDYDIAVFSVDFDPALQGNNLPLSSQYAVLVAVENRGTITTYNINVEATLTDKTTNKRLIDGSRQISELSPGEIEVVRIESQSSIPPIAATYVLAVQAAPLPEETIVSNNTRTFTINVTP